MAQTTCIRTSTHTRASALRPSHLRRRNYPALSLVELLIGLSLGAVILTAIATALQVMSSNLRANQAQLMGMRAARVAIDYVTTQLRQADKCVIVSPSNLVTSTDTTTYPYNTYPVEATEIKLIADGGKGRSDSTAADYVEVHLQTNGGGLTVWKDTGDGTGTARATWHGVTYEGNTDTTQRFAIPYVTSAKILCDMVGTDKSVRAVFLQLTLDVADQHGQTIRIPMTSSVKIRRIGS